MGSQTFNPRLKVYSVDWIRASIPRASISLFSIRAFPSRRTIFNVAGTLMPPPGRHLPRVSLTGGPVTVLQPTELEKYKNLQNTNLIWELNTEKSFETGF